MKRLFVLAIALAIALGFGTVSSASGQEELNICIDVEKTGPVSASPGETITYHFWVKNCGEVPFLSHAYVRDPLINPYGYIWIGDLYPGDIAEFDWPKQMPTNYCGPIVNTTQAIGYPVLNGVLLPDTAYDYSSWTVNVFCAPGTGTPGYWMNHPEAWPVEAITIGGVTYPKMDAIAYMLAPVKGDKTFTMFSALVAAKLDVLIGNRSDCIAATIAEADAWMASFPLGSGVAGLSQAWQYSHGEKLYWLLDQYNNGDASCVSSRDDLE